MSGITDAFFSFAVLSPTELAITGINPANATYSATNPNWGTFPVIPSKYAGLNTVYNGNGNSANAYKIVEISAYAFDSLTAFSETTISATFLHSNLKRIGESAFASVKLKGTLTIPATIDTVGVKAFYNTLITDVVIGSTTNSNIVPHLGILTSAINQEINTRIAADNSLSLLKAPIDAPTFTGTATIPNASIGLATIGSVSIASANVNNANITSASLTTVNVVGNAAFGGNVSTTGAWNFTIQPKMSDDLVATESYVNAQIGSVAGAGLGTSLNTLGELATAIGNDPSFATNIINSYLSISSTIVNETGVRSTTISALSSALSASAVSLTTVDSTLSTALSAETSARIPSVPSLSTALSNAVSSLQSVDSALSTALSTEVSARSSDVSATSGILGTAVSSLQSVDSTLSTTLSTEIGMRASAVASLAPAIDASAAALTTSDVNLSTALSTETSKRVSAIASVTQPQSTAFVSLTGVDTALSTTLSTEISTRTGSISSLSVSASSGSESLQLTNVQFSIALATEVGARSTSILSLSNSASASVSAFISTNSSILTTLSTESSSRGSAVSSASTSVINTAVPINASITAQNNALTTETSVRNSQINSISAGVSLSAASLTTANSAISAALLTEGVNRSSAISTAIENVLSGAPPRFNTLEKIASEIQNTPTLTLNASTLLTVSALKAGTSAEISTRISAVASVSNTAIPSLVAMNAGMSGALSTETVARGSAVASLSSALSSASVSFATVDVVLSGALSAETVNRISTFLSVSAAISTTASTLTATDNALSTALTAEIGNREIDITSLTSAMSLSFASLDVTKTALSLGLSTEIFTRTASVASVSGAIATSFTSLQTANNALNSGLAALSAGLAPKATTLYLDGKISMMLNGAPDNLNTLAEMAAALGNNPSFTSSIIAVLSTKAETTAVNALSAAISAKGGLTEFNSLTSVVSNKANDGIITTVNNSIVLLNNTVNALAATMSTLQMNGGVTNTNAIQVNGVTLSALANRIQELYYNLGKANPSWGIINSDGTVNYKLNRFTNPSLVSSSLGFEYNSDGAVTKVNQLVTVKFDKDQKSVTITGGVGTTTSTVNDMVLDSNNNYLFVVPYNGDVAYYAAYKTGVTITALENQYKFAPLAPTITISAPNETSSQFATPTVTTPYANLTWNPNTQIITQQITVNTQDANATLQFGLGSYSAANITIEAATGAIAVIGQTNRFSTSSTSAAFNIKYLRNLVGTGSGAISVNILGISSKLPSASLTISNVINDNNLPPPPPPALNAGTVPSTLAFSSNFSNGFNQPMGIALDATGDIYVCDFNNHRIQQFNGTGGYIRSFGSQGFGNGYFNNPMGIAIDATGNIYVCDTFNHRIQKFTSAGAYLSQFGSQGSGNGSFYYPKGIAIDATGNIYIADTNNNRIQKFTSAGAYVSKFGSGGSADGSFNFPYGIAFDATGNIYVCDSSNHRIQKFTSGGAYVSKFGSQGSGNLELNYPYGIAIDAAGYIYVCERSNNRIHKFDSNYSHVALYGVNQFLSPYGVVINAAGQLIVSDTLNHRIQIWS